MAGKKYKNALTKIDAKKSYDLVSAINIIKENSTTKFISSVDIVVKLNLDTSKPDQQLRGAISLPYYVGKKLRILAVTDNIELAKSAGADFAGSMEIIENIKNGWLDFDIILTEPKFMIELGKLGKILGPKGLMPNIKTGTVGNDIAKLVHEFRQGKQEYRTDPYGNVHMQIGKTNLETEKILTNINSLLDVIKSKKPSAVKGTYIQNVFLSSTMGPSIKVVFNQD